MQTLAFWLTSMCSSLSMGYTVSYSFLLISIILEYFLSNPYICYLVYMKNPPFWLTYVKILFQAVPAYNYSLIFGGIVVKSGRHFDLMTKSWVEGPGFDYSDLFEGKSLSILKKDFQVIS